MISGPNLDAGMHMGDIHGRRTHGDDDDQWHGVGKQTGTVIRWHSPSEKERLRVLQRMISDNL